MHGFTLFMEEIDSCHNLCSSIARMFSQPYGCFMHVSKLNDKPQADLF